MVGPVHASSPPPTIFAAPDGFFDDAVFWTVDAEINAHKTDKPDTRIDSPTAAAEQLSDRDVTHDTESSATRGESAVQTGGGDLENGAGGGGKTCHTCGHVFEVLEEQRYHFKSDWHRLNVCKLTLCLRQGCEI